MSTPKISFLVVVFRMSRQAENTLISLSAAHQKNVSEEDYEIVVVENRSEDLLGAERALATGKNVRYFLREETTKTPVFALNFAFEASRAPLVCLVIDGARMVTPRLVEHALLAQRLAPHPLIAVPSYHLGQAEHHQNVSAGYDETVEAKLLEGIDWTNNGYDLFKISCLSAGNEKGFLSPMLECSCLFTTRESFEKIGRADERFDLPGGGSVNIHVYASLARLPESKFIVLGGEGSFHQFHGGVTTAEIADRESVLESHRAQLRAVNGGKFEGVHREPMMLGVISAQAHAFLKLSLDRAAFHLAACKKLGWPEWYQPAENKIGMSALAQTVATPPYLPRSLRFVAKRMVFSTWVDHLPFGYDLVGALRPSVITELGTQAGVSYFCMCQSVREHDLTARAYAVDTWKGDLHTDPYGKEIYDQVLSHNTEHYADFSTLMPMLFEEALPHFREESIDLLHIDGFHTYEAVRGDFEAWYPKVKPGGIVIFHDVAARLKDFGAWRFWAELADTHETFAFRHGFGLGVLRKPGPTPEAPLFDFLFSKDERVKARLRGFYVHAAEYQELERKMARLETIRARRLAEAAT